ncbi:MAG: flippase-like domain-containing protein [Thermoplasmata archaeon]|nr:flippase-like domain-containing protein [Thermoplasmata archaeon]
MTSARRRAVSIAAGIAISIVFMGLLFRNINLGELMAALGGANYWWLAPNIVMVMFAMYQRAYRWKFMLRPVKEVPFDKLLAATCIGFMANNVLPLRLGEFVRAYSLAYQDRGVSKSASLATIFVERMVFDLVALLLIFGAVLAFAGVSVPDEMKAGVYLAILVALSGLALVLYLALRPTQAGEKITRYLFFLPDRVKETIKIIVVKFSTGLEFMTQAKTSSWVGIQTIFIWLFMGASNYFVFLAFGFDLPLEASYFLLVVVSISILLPSSPGFVGVYHAGTVFTLTQYGIGKEEALSFALVLHAAQYVPITLMGFYYLRKEHLSLNQLGRDAVGT